ncbi:MAG: hypothetical protein JWO36_7432 [Myxococcales bacterium]|nr:hypothetical protein [Myxococcales bacterium]
MDVVITRTQLRPTTGSPTVQMQLGEALFDADTRRDHFHG